MNAPAIINAAHEVLLRADDALSVTDVASELNGTTKPNKSQIKAAERQLKELNGLGLIEPEFRTGGVAFYRLIVAPAVQVGDTGVADIAQPAECVAVSGDSEGGETDAQAVDGDDWIPWIATADSMCPVLNKTRVRVRLRGGGEEVGCADIFRWNTINCIPIVAYKISQPACADFATTPELQYLATEDYEMPPADPALLAMANHELSRQISSIAETVAPYLPDPSDISTARAVEILDMLVEAQSKYIRMLELDAKGAHCVADSLMRQINELRTRAIEQASQHRAELATERQAREALQEQAAGPVGVAGYIVRAAKRKPRTIMKADTAKSAALGAIRAGAQRADVFALVLVGTARRGAEWGDAQ